MKIKNRRQLLLTNPKLHYKLSQENLLDKIYPISILWTKKTCLQEAKKYKSSSKWQRSSPGSFGVAWKKGWLNSIRKDVGFKVQKHIPRNKASCLKEAKKYKNNKEWRKNSRYSYNIALKNGWVDSIRNQLGFKIKKRKSWDFKTVQNEAKKYSYPTEWKNKSPATYAAAVYNKWFNVCTKHMIRYNTSFKKTKNLDTNEIFNSSSLAAKSLGFNQSAISNAISQKCKAGGYNWAYCDENGKVIK